MSQCNNYETLSAESVAACHLPLGEVSAKLERRAATLPSDLPIVTPELYAISGVIVDNAGNQKLDQILPHPQAYVPEGAPEPSTVSLKRQIDEVSFIATIATHGSPTNKKLVDDLSEKAATGRRAEYVQKEACTGCPFEAYCPAVEEIEVSKVNGQTAETALRGLANHVRPLVVANRMLRAIRLQPIFQKTKSASMKTEMLKAMVEANKTLTSSLLSVVQSERDTFLVDVFRQAAKRLNRTKVKDRFTGMVNGAISEVTVLEGLAHIFGSDNVRQSTDREDRSQATDIVVNYKGQMVRVDAKCGKWLAKLEGKVENFKWLSEHSAIYEKDIRAGDEKRKERILVINPDFLMKRTANNNYGHVITVCEAGTFYHYPTLVDIEDAEFRHVLSAGVKACARENLNKSNAKTHQHLALAG